MTGRSIDPARFALFERFAQQRCDIPTLHTRGRDGLDFHDISVTALLDLMNAAYEAGAASSGRTP